MAENQAKNNSPGGENTAAESFQPNGGGKTVWPELVGVSAEEAERKVKQEMPLARVEVVPMGSPVTFDFRSDRVRLHVDSSGKVVMPPSIG